MSIIVDQVADRVDLVVENFQNFIALANLTKLRSSLYSYTHSHIRTLFHRIISNLFPIFHPQRRWSMSGILQFRQENDMETVRTVKIGGLRLNYLKNSEASLFSMQEQQDFHIAYLK